MKYLVHHTAISVRDLQASRTFYEQLGFQQVHRYDEPDSSLSIVHLKLGDYFLEIFAYQNNKHTYGVSYAQGNDLDKIGVKHIALQTDDIQAALADLQAKDLARSDTVITFGRTKVSYFFIQDPDGVWVEIVKDDRYK